MARGRTSSKKKGGRRRNYEPTVEATGLKKFFPTGWANWVGTCLFGFLSIALFVEFIAALGRRSEHTDWIPAIILAFAFAWIAVLFAITRWKDYI